MGGAQGDRPDDFGDDRGGEDEAGLGIVGTIVPTLCWSPGGARLEWAPWPRCTSPPTSSARSARWRRSAAAGPRDQGPARGGARSRAPVRRPGPALRGAAGRALRRRAARGIPRRMGRLMHDALGSPRRDPARGHHRFLVYRVEHDGSGAALVNPVLEWSSRDEDAWRRAACSLPGVHVDVDRPIHVRVRAQDGDGDESRRGLRPRGPRPPARDGPPRRRADPRPRARATSAGRPCAPCASAEPGRAAA